MLLAADLQPLDAGRRYWWRPAAVARGRNRMMNTVAKVLSVTPSVSLRDLGNAVRRPHRARYYASPIEILGSACASQPELAVTDGYVSRVASGRQDYSALSPSERALVAIFEREGPVIRRGRLEAVIDAAGVGVDTLNVWASYSPLLWRPAPSCFALVGAPIAPGTIEALAPEAPRHPHEAEFAWTAASTVAITIRLGETRAAELYVPTAWRGLEGRYVSTQAWASGLALRMTDGGLRGVRALASALSIDIGDILLISLHAVGNVFEA